ncbi:hypothetical protein BJV74DRAFT_986317 [Russula compacta]|nr:hypothetical protein BJV74DRAFT_986317 [Russula compacta]
MLPEDNCDSEVRVRGCLSLRLSSDSTYFAKALVRVRYLALHVIGATRESNSVSTRFPPLGYQVAPTFTLAQTRFPAHQYWRSRSNNLCPRRGDNTSRGPKHASLVDGSFDSTLQIQNRRRKTGAQRPLIARPYPDDVNRVPVRALCDWKPPNVFAGSGPVSVSIGFTTGARMKGLVWQMRAFPVALFNLVYLSIGPF